MWNEPTDSRLRSERPASLWPALRAASPWQFTRPADTMRFVRAGQLPLSRCAQPPHGRWDLQRWLWWVAERRPNVTAHRVGRVLGLCYQILTTLYLFRFGMYLIPDPFFKSDRLYSIKDVYRCFIRITPSIICLGFFLLTRFNKTEIWNLRMPCCMSMRWFSCTVGPYCFKPTEPCGALTNDSESGSWLESL